MAVEGDPLARLFDRFLQPAVRPLLAAARSGIRSATPAISRTLNAWADFESQYAAWALAPMFEGARSSHPRLLFGLTASARERGLASRCDDAILEHVASAVFEPSLLLDTAAAVSDSPAFEAAQRELVTAGLAAVREPGRTWSVPAALLLEGLEGSLWLVATQQGVLPADRRVSRVRGYRHISNPAELVRPGQAQLRDLSPRLGQTLERCVFTPRGHDLRHGRSVDGARAHTVATLAGLVMWLDWTSGSDVSWSLDAQLRARLAEMSETMPIAQVSRLGMTGTPPAAPRMAGSASRLAST